MKTPFHPTVNVGLTISRSHLIAVGLPASSHSNFKKCICVKRSSFALSATAVRLLR